MSTTQEMQKRARLRRKAIAKKAKHDKIKKMLADNKPLVEICNELNVQPRTVARVGGFEAVVKAHNAQNKPTIKSTILSFVKSLFPERRK